MGSGHLKLTGFMIIKIINSIYELKKKISKKFLFIIIMKSLTGLKKNIYDVQFYLLSLIIEIVNIIEYYLINLKLQN